jgi:hypothetical protein
MAARAARPTLAWLARQFGRRGGAVATAYRQALSPASPRGRLILADLARLCGAGRTSFVPGDALETAFNEGKRAVFLHLTAVLSLSAGEVAALDLAPLEAPDGD